MLGYGETAAGLGLMVGPILGGSLNDAFGYFWCYMILAVILFIDMAFTAVVMPNSLNNNGRNKDETLVDKHEREEA